MLTCGPSLASTTSCAVSTESSPYYESAQEMMQFADIIEDRTALMPLPSSHDDNRSLFAGLDLSDLDSPDFKEDSVREEIVKPLLAKLGYTASGKYRIQRSKKLQHPFVKTASGK